MQLATRSFTLSQPTKANALHSKVQRPGALRPSPRSLVPIRAFQEDDRNKQQPYKVKNGDSALVPAFTRRRERIIGRIASIGVAAMWFGEVLSGLGPLTQVSAETGVPMNLVYASTALLAGSQLALGLFKGPTFSAENQRDVARRTKGLTGISAIEPDVNKRIQPTKEPGKFLLRGELTLGRAAMLIFAGACLLEYVWNGESPLAHLGLIQPGVPISQAPTWLNAGCVLFILNGLGVFSGFNTNKDPDTY